MPSTIVVVEMGVGRSGGRDVVSLGTHYYDLANGGVKVVSDELPLVECPEGLLCIPLRELGPILDGVRDSLRGNGIMTCIGPGAGVAFDPSYALDYRQLYGKPYGQRLVGQVARMAGGRLAIYQAQGGALVVPHQAAMMGRVLKETLGVDPGRRYPVSMLTDWMSTALANEGIVRRSASMARCNGTEGPGFADLCAALGISEFGQKLCAQEIVSADRIRKAELNLWIHQGGHDTAFATMAAATMNEGLQLEPGQVRAVYSTGDWILSTVLLAGRQLQPTQELLDQNLAIEGDTTALYLDENTISAGGLYGKIVGDAYGGDFVAAVSDASKHLPWLGKKLPVARDGKPMKDAADLLMMCGGCAQALACIISAVDERMAAAADRLAAAVGAVPAPGAIIGGGWAKNVQLARLWGLRGREFIKPPHADTLTADGAAAVAGHAYDRAAPHGVLSYKERVRRIWGVRDGLPLSVTA